MPCARCSAAAHALAWLTCCNAFSFANGLDITRTDPPIPLLIDTIAARDRSAHRYAVVQHTPVEPVINVSAVTSRYLVVGSGRGCFVVSLH